VRTLVPGERAEVAGTLVVSLDVPVQPPLGLALIGLDRGRQLPGTFAPIDSIRRELRPAAEFDEGGCLRLDLDHLPASVDRLVLVAFLTTGPGGGLAFRQWQGVEVRTMDFRFPISLVDRSDTALVLVEIYRHEGRWRLQANGQGFVHGLPALARAYGGSDRWAERLVRGSACEPSSTRAEAGPDRSEGRPAGGSGSGVAVDEHHILTNAHVVDGALSISAMSEGRALDAQLVFLDPRNDLALLRAKVPLTCSTRLRSTSELHLGEDVVALGFPLQGLLGTGPQVSAGNIAALAGVGNDTSVFQFTAPIASGNSGGPILDAAGLLIGLVSSSLNIERIRANGSTAENVNFGIKAATVRSFLDAYGITPAIAPSPVAVSRASMVRIARRDLYRIDCSC
jgi:S1-C subfamily serine protease